MADIEGADPVVQITGFEGDDRDDIIWIRHSVFTLEQKVDPEIDLDGEDGAARHILVRERGRPVGTGRILEDGHIGRIAVVSSHRKKKVGKMIMKALIDFARERGDERIFLGAQIQAMGFYKALGFVPYGKVYEEAGIQHQRMEMRLSPVSVC